MFFKLSNATDEKEARATAIESCNILLECGLTKPLATLKMEDIPQIVKSASLHSTILRIKSELDQFISGLESAGLLPAIRKYPDLFSPMFEYQGATLTAGECWNNKCSAGLLPSHGSDLPFHLGDNAWFYTSLSKKQTLMDALL